MLPPGTLNPEAAEQACPSLLQSRWLCFNKSGCHWAPRPPGTRQTPPAPSIPGPGLILLGGHTRCVHNIYARNKHAGRAALLLRRCGRSPQALNYTHKGNRSYSKGNHSRIRRGNRSYSKNNHNRDSHTPTDKMRQVQGLCRWHSLATSRRPSPSLAASPSLFRPIPNLFRPIPSRDSILPALRSAQQTCRRASHQSRRRQIPGSRRPSRPRHIPGSHRRQSRGSRRRQNPRGMPPPVRLRPTRQPARPKQLHTLAVSLRFSQSEKVISPGVAKKHLKEFRCTAGHRSATTPDETHLRSKSFHETAKLRRDDQAATPTSPTVYLLSRNAQPDAHFNPDGD